VFETYWTTGRATEAMGSVYGLLDTTVYGRQETFENSPPGWPQFWRNTGEQWRVNGRPTSQWERLAAGRSRLAAPHWPPARRASQTAVCGVMTPERAS
jgi:uncharacterized protein DUF899